MTERDGTEDVRLPDGTIDLVKDLVPAVRGLLRHGLSDEFQKACVRVGCFQNFGGGLKASLVQVSSLTFDTSRTCWLGLAAQPTEAQASSERPFFKSWRIA